MDGCASLHSAKPLVMQRSETRRASLGTDEQRDGKREKLSRHYFGTNEKETRMKRGDSERKFVRAERSIRPALEHGKFKANTPVSFMQRGPIEQSVVSTILSRHSITLKLPSA